MIRSSVPGQSEGLWVVHEGIEAHAVNRQQNLRLREGIAEEFVDGLSLPGIDSCVVFNIIENPGSSVQIAQVLERIFHPGHRRR